MAEPRYILDHRTYCDRFVAEARLLASAAEGAAPDTPVPTCPGWTLAKLLKHVGTAHAWAAANTRARSADTAVPPRSLDLGLPAEPAALPGWLVEGAERAAATLRDTDPEAAVWTFGPVRHARFWSRRMLCETLVHRVDARWAVAGVGADPGIDPDTAADAVDELLTVVSGRPPRLSQERGPAGRSGGTVHLHATDVHGDTGEWTVTLTPDGMSWERGHAKGDAALRGPAVGLLLVSYGRRAVEETGAEVFGDRALLDRWSAASRL